MTRSLGDFEFKPYLMNADVSSRVVIPDPEVTVVPRNSTQRHVTVACDGVWDVLGNSQVVSMVHRAFDNGQDAAEEVVFASVEAHSGDNITAIVVQL